MTFALTTHRSRWMVSTCSAWAWRWNRKYGRTQAGFETYWRIGWLYIQRWQWQEDVR